MQKWKKNLSKLTLIVSPQNVSPMEKGRKTYETKRVRVKLLQHRFFSQKYCVRGNFYMFIKIYTCKGEDFA